MEQLNKRRKSYHPDWDELYTAIDIVQTFGRGKRNGEDYCDTWLADGSFGDVLPSVFKHFPFTKDRVQIDGPLERFVNSDNPIVMEPWQLIEALYHDTSEYAFYSQDVIGIHGKNEIVTVTKHRISRRIKGNVINIDISHAKFDCKGNEIQPDWYAETIRRVPIDEFINVYLQKLIANNAEVWFGYANHEENAKRA